METDENKWNREEETPRCSLEVSVQIQLQYDCYDNQSLKLQQSLETGRTVLWLWYWAGPEEVRPQLLFLPQTPGVTLHKSLDLPGTQFPTCEMGLINPPSVDLDCNLVKAGVVSGYVQCLAQGVRNRR